SSVPRRRSSASLAVAGGAVLVTGFMVWMAVSAAGNPDPTAANNGSTVAVLDIGVLVFREGLECILVLAAVTAGMVGSQESFQRPVAAGAGLAFLATLLTWSVAIRILDDLTTSISALTVQ